MNGGPPTTDSLMTLVCLPPAVVWSVRRKSMIPKELL